MLVPGEYVVFVVDRTRLIGNSRISNAMLGLHIGISVVIIVKSHVKSTEFDEFCVKQLHRVDVVTSVSGSRKGTSYVQ